MRVDRSHVGGVPALGCLLALAFFLLSAPAAPQEGADAITVTFFDVGQADAALIAFPDGQRVLIDSGRGPAVVDHLRAAGVDTIDLFITSHNHADHIGGAAAVLRAFPVRFYMDNGVDHTTLTYLSLLETLVELEVPVLAPERRTVGLGDAFLEILPPPGDPALGQNDNSVGVMLHFGEFRAFFGGDAEERLWSYWLEHHGDRLDEVQVLKASHHGSRNGDTRVALERLSPRLVVVSAGKENPYGHPHPEALARYARVGAEVLVVAEVGTVTVAGTADGRFTVWSGTSDEAVRRPMGQVMAALWRSALLPPGWSPSPLRRRAGSSCPEPTPKSG